MELFDLHVHTRYSDGKYKINEVLEMAKNRGLTKISITDHDTIIKLKNYKELEQIYGIEILPGVEISTDTKKLHILGYGIKDIDHMEEVLMSYKIYNCSICLEVLELLQKHGYDITLEEIKENMQREGHDSLLDKREIVKVLIRKGYASNVKEAYDNIIGRNTKLYVPIAKMSAEDAIRLINECGGVAVIAHPGSLKLNSEELSHKVLELMTYGLSGIEVVNGNTSLEDRLTYERIGDLLGLIKTYGSDFHDESRNLGLLENADVWYDIIGMKDKVLLKEDKNGIK